MIYKIHMYPLSDGILCNKATFKQQNLLVFTIENHYYFKSLTKMKLKPHFMGIRLF